MKCTPIWDSRVSFLLTSRLKVERGTENRAKARPQPQQVLGKYRARFNGIGVFICPQISFNLTVVHYRLYEESSCQTACDSVRGVVWEAMGAGGSFCSCHYFAPAASQGCSAGRCTPSRRIWGGYTFQILRCRTKTSAPGRPSLTEELATSRDG